MDIVDKINRGIGRTKIKLGSQDVGRTWKMKQEKLSPRFTTRINEVISIKA
jgi:DNA polymerase V